jgi:hypothetical protein
MLTGEENNTSFHAPATKLEKLAVAKTLVGDLVPVHKYATLPVDDIVVPAGIHIRMPAIRQPVTPRT